MAKGRPWSSRLQVELNRAAGKRDQIQKARADGEAIVIRQGRADEPRVTSGRDQLLRRWRGPRIGRRQDQPAGMEPDLVR